MPSGPYDPRAERKVTKVTSRAVRHNVLTAASDWGAGGWERQQPRYMEGDEKRPPIPHPYRKHPTSGSSQDRPTPISTGGSKNKGQY
jgi:hypothetical protein